VLALKNGVLLLHLPFLSFTDPEYRRPLLLWLHVNLFRPAIGGFLYCSVRRGGACCRSLPPSFATAAKKPTRKGSRRIACVPEGLTSTPLAGLLSSNTESPTPIGAAACRAPGRGWSYNQACLTRPSLLGHRQRRDLRLLILVSAKSSQNHRCVCTLAERTRVLVVRWTSTGVDLAFLYPLVCMSEILTDGLVRWSPGPQRPKLARIVADGEIACPTGALLEDHGVTRCSDR